MQVKSIQLKHTLHFADLYLEFPDQPAPVTVIFGRQGSGKTGLLKTIHQALTWFAARHKEPRTTGLVMPDQDILLGRLQSKIDLCIRFPVEIGSFETSSNQQESDPHLCQWQLYKTLNAQGVGISKAETQTLEQLIQMYQSAQKKDQYIGSPLIAYYPAERLCHEVNLLNKNNPLTFQLVNAYDIAPLPFTAFTKFFEWLREISDIENAAIASAVKTIIQHSPKNTHSPSTLFAQQINQAYQQLQHPHFRILQRTLQAVIPEIDDLYVQHQPKLQFTVVSAQKSYSFQQLSSSLKMQICLIGDLVRRLCILNPKSLDPCLEGEGILIIDAIDQQLDTEQAANFLNQLHQVFPRLQIITSSQRRDLIDFSEDWHCMMVTKHGVSPLKPLSSSTHYDDWYSQQLADALLPDLETLHTSATPTSIEEWLALLHKQLDPQQRLALAEQLAPNSDSSSLDALK